MSEPEPLRLGPEGQRVLVILIVVAAILVGIWAVSRSSHKNWDDDPAGGRP